MKKFTREKLEKMSFSNEFIEKLDNVIEEDGYEYRVMVSRGIDRSFYDNHSDDEIIKCHLEHISIDYYEDDGLETIISNGYITKVGEVVGEFLFRRKK